MSSLLVEDGVASSTVVEGGTMSSLNDDSSPVALPQHMISDEITVSSILHTLSVSVAADVSETMNGNVGMVQGRRTSPTVSGLHSSHVSLTSTKVNACDIVLAVDDPFAIPIDQLIANDSQNVDVDHTELLGFLKVTATTNDMLRETTVDPHTELNKSVNIGIDATPDPIKVAIAATQPVNIIREDSSQLYPYELTRSEKSIPVKEIVVDTSEDAVLSLSSSRRVPVTAETAVTADSSPSLQRGTVQSVSRVSRHNKEPERLSSSIASTSANHECSISATVERPADIHSITDNILAAAACVADNAVWNNAGRANIDLNDDRCREESKQQTDQLFRKKRPRPGSGNCPVRLCAYLKERYIAAPTMIFQLTDFSPDDITLNTFEHQIIHIPWNSPGQQAMSETPCIRTMLQFCYALSAWLYTNSTSVASMSSSRSSRHCNFPVAIVSCTNGKTRTAIAIACYLKFAGIVDNVQSGFCHFLERRCGREIMSRSPESIVTDLPASLHTFFRNFDTAVELVGYMNYKPLILKAITLQGVPLEDQPCLDLWDSTGHHVYSSHPHLWSELNLSCSLDPNTAITSQWADEEGFFRVNRVIQGDFCLLCRFGGIYASDITDSSKILFRYANSTAFMGAASPYELQCHQVDIQRRYVHYFDDEDFMLTLLFEADWNSSKLYSEILSVDCGEEVLPAITTCADAKELGWHVIARYHTAAPTENDVSKLAIESLGELDGCPNHLLSLALQLANFDHAMAQTILLEGRLRSWWQAQQDDVSIIVRDEPFYNSPTIFDDLKPTSRDETMGKIRDVMKLRTINRFESSNIFFEEPQSDSRSSSDCSIVSSSANVDNKSFYISSIMRPNCGDIASTLHATKVSSIFHNSDPSFIGDHPIFPVIPRRRKRGNAVPIEHPDNTTATELLLKMDHPGVYLQDLSMLTESLIAVTSDMANESPGRIEQLDSTITTNHIANTNILSIGIEGINKASINVLNDTQEEALQVGNSPSVENILILQTKADFNLADDISIKDDPAFTKYFKMKKIGIPDGAVRNAMIKDGVDTSVLDLDPERSMKSQTSFNVDIPIDSNIDDIPIKDDPAFSKYFKMKKMGIPDGAVRNAMIKDGVDSSVLDLDSEHTIQSQSNAKSSDNVDLPIDNNSDDIPIKDDPAFSKYFKMKKLGIPDGAVRIAMIKDGADTSVLDLDSERSIKSQTNAKSSDTADLPIKDDPNYQKYFKMVSVGLPDGAVRNAMIKDGLDSSILDLDHSRSLSSQRPASHNHANAPLRDDPEWSKYFKMLRMGLPLGAVKNAADKDGRDSSILDLDPLKSIQSQREGYCTQSNQTVLHKKKPVKRKKIFWNPLNSGQIKADSLWSNLKGRLQMSQLKYDEKEFAELFTESTDPTDKLKGNLERKVKAKAKKSVQVIDGKRSMNGGIVLARLRVGYSKIAEMVENMYIGKLDSTSLAALKEMLPTSEETMGLLAFVSTFGTVAEENQRAYDQFSECEKYMYSMITVTNASAKIDCMQFRAQFQSRYDELLDSIEIVEKACDEVRASERLQTVMAMILTVVNQINTGGDGNEAAGFTLDALLKLNEAKAFDKKTSVLHYLVKLIKQNNESLLGLRDDLNHLRDAEFIVLDNLCNDITGLQDEIGPVLETVKSQADFLEESGKLVQMSLKELAEQKTSVRTVANVPQYNKIDHHTGRTPMERFILNASVKIEEAVSYTDKVKVTFSKVLEYFGEDGNMASNVFFGTMNSFLADFSKAVAYVHKEDLAKQREVAKETKRLRAVELKESSLRIENVIPTKKLHSLSRNGEIVDFKDISKNKNVTEPIVLTSSAQPQVNLNKTIPYEYILTTCEVTESTLSFDTATADEGTTIFAQVDDAPANMELLAVPDNEFIPEKLQEWLTTVHDATQSQKKLNKILDPNELSDSISSDDFCVTENVERQIDRQSEWLAAVRASTQKYKVQTL